jgi:hypothetical protein
MGETRLRYVPRVSGSDGLGSRHTMDLDREHGNSFRHVL